MVRKESGGGASSMCAHPLCHPRKMLIRCYTIHNCWKHAPPLDRHANFPRCKCAHGECHNSSGIGKWRRWGEAQWEGGKRPQCGSKATNGVVWVRHHPRAAGGCGANKDAKGGATHVVPQAIVASMAHPRWLWQLVGGEPEV